MNRTDLKSLLKNIFGLWSKNKFSKKEYEYKVVRKHLIILLIIYIINLIIIYLYKEPGIGFGLILLYYAIVIPTRPYDEDEQVELFTNKYFLSTFLIFALYFYLLTLA